MKNEQKTAEHAFSKAVKRRWLRLQSLFLGHLRGYLVFPGLESCLEHSRGQFMFVPILERFYRYLVKECHQPPKHPWYLIIWCSFRQHVSWQPTNVKKWLRSDHVVVKMSQDALWGSHFEIEPKLKQNCTENRNMDKKQPRDHHYTTEDPLHIRSVAVRQWVGWFDASIWSTQTVCGR